MGQTNLPKGAGPREWISLQLKQLNRHRFGDCPIYSSCLSYAAHLGWIGWTCSSCQLFPGQWADENKISKSFSRRRSEVIYAIRMTGTGTRRTKDESELLLRIIEETLAGKEE